LIGRGDGTSHSRLQLKFACPSIEKLSRRLEYEKVRSSAIQIVFPRQIDG
jgi:hypothetical protein